MCTGFGVEEGRNECDGCQAVGDGVMHLEEQAEPAALETREKPQLPKWMRTVEQRAEEQFCSGKQRGFVPRWRDGFDVDVMIDREIRIIDPERAATNGWRAPYHEAQFRNARQPPIQAAFDRFEIQAAASIGQRVGIDDTKSTDVLRPM